MFYLVKAEITTPIAPDQIDPEKDINDVALGIVREALEGTVHPDFGYIIAILSGRTKTFGYITTQTPSIFFKVYVEMLVFKPENNEVVEGSVENAIETGVFVNLGFQDAFISINALGQDHFVYDIRTGELQGTRTQITIRRGDWIRGKLLPAATSIIVAEGARWSKTRITVRTPIRLDRVTGELRIRMSSREPGLGLLKVIFRNKVEST
ncbi:MAG: S1 RNA-binding domain-containing protein [Crenarchaeota archaeon]|nr:S1 RNA-binding domain-containing protein [Thermoproteota archaeon]MCR8455315.1 S1 RNA-binding domain-containing protein [Thermoproteota archaeon]MCR8500797.1 S1 RNA-binding domain-containing protein [Thermoproteota archaeon]